MPLSHVDRILENVNHGVTAEKLAWPLGVCGPIPQPINGRALNQLGAARFNLSRFATIPLPWLISVRP